MFSHSAVLKAIFYSLKLFSKFLNHLMTLWSCALRSIWLIFKRNKTKQLKTERFGSFAYFFFFICTVQQWWDHEQESHGWKHFKWFPLTLTCLVTICNLLQIESNKEKESFGGFLPTALPFVLIMSLDFACQPTSLTVALTLRRKLLHFGRFFT